MLTKTLKISGDGTLSSIMVSTPNNRSLSIQHDYSLFGDVVLAVFSKTIVMFGVADHSDKLRRRGLLDAALRYYAENHNETLVTFFEGELGVGGTRSRIVPLKRGIYITIGSRWIFTYRPGVHVKAGLQFDKDSLAYKVSGITPQHEPLNFEMLLDECQQLRSFK